MKTENECNDILSMVTHDLKSPLTAVIGAIELLSFDDLSQEEKDECLKIATKATKNIFKLVENILVMAKFEAGKELIELEHVQNLEEHFEDIVKTFKYEMKMKQIDFNVKIEKKLPSVYWDIDKIHYHAINNLISNAIKFTPLGGNISLSVESKKNKYIVIKIKDNGIGISQEQKKTIFQKYETHNNKKIFKGAGLGLYNAYNFIQRHNGDIEITKGLNKRGIGFKITIPIKASPIYPEVV